MRIALGCALVAAVAVFLFASHRAIRSTERRWIERQAQACAAALQPSEGGDLTGSIRSLREHAPAVVAVAVLDAFGDVQTVSPDLPPLREAAESILSAGPPAETIVRSGLDGPIRVTGTVVPLNGEDWPHARRVLVLLRGNPTTALRTAALWFATLMVLVFAGVDQILTRWFRTHVSRPLRQVGAGIGAVEAVESGVFHQEIAAITEQLAQLARAARESERRARRIVQEARKQIEQRMAGWAHQLRRAQDQATMDPLTGLRNRAYLDEHLESIFQQHRTAGQDLSAVMLDMDNFKAYNDTFGHPAGDALLEFIGGLLRGCLRPTDAAVRYGGDEFLLLLPETTAAQARLVAERIVNLFGQHVRKTETRHRPSLSAGVASICHDAPTTGKELIARADARLYDAKRKGKNTVTAAV
ncbi:MAG: GGDEF domain-containing protein [Planctomycetota bacterium]|nr:MAG: GGDEF domain-containing protein [Planctomycetota bacterium]